MGRNSSVPRNKALLPSQKAWFYHAITAIEGLQPHQFEWRDEWGLYADSPGVDDYRVPSLALKGTDFHFTIERLERGWHLEVSPGNDVYLDAGNVDSWDAVKRRSVIWLSRAKTECGQPDVWAELDAYQPTGDEAIEFSGSNTRFVYEDVTQISKAIQEIREFLRELSGSYAKLADSMDSVNGRLDYLQEKAKTQGRKDWSLMAIGTVTSIAGSVALDPGNMRTLWGLLKAALKAVRLLPPG